MFTFDVHTHWRSEYFLAIQSNMKASMHGIIKNTIKKKHDLSIGIIQWHDGEKDFLPK